MPRRRTSSAAKIRALPQPKNPSFGDTVLTPRETRALVAKKGWNAVVAFQTRNPLHRAHEYALVYALERSDPRRQERGSRAEPAHRRDEGRRRQRGHPHADVPRPASTTAPWATATATPQLWKPRGESVPDRVVLLGVDIKMFYGGPKEAVMHSIYRQNMGFTNIVIGRKHADAPYADGTPIWGDFDAQDIFSKLKGDLKIKPIKVGFAAFYESLGRVDLTERHPERKARFDLRQRGPCHADARRPRRPADHAAQHVADPLGGNEELTRAHAPHLDSTASARQNWMVE